MEGSDPVSREPGRRAAVWRRWLAFGACFAAVLAAVPVARGLRKWIAGHLGDSFVLWLTVAIGAAAVAWFLPRTLRKVEQPRAKLTWWLLVLAVLWLGARGVGHAEWFHLVEYSALSVLAYRALALHLPDAGVFPAAAALTALAGAVDEIAQWYAPGRVWDLRDVALDVFVAVMIQILLWRGVAHPEIAERIGARSLRVACRLWMAFAALLLLCLFNTTEVMATYLGKVPFTGHIHTRGLDYLMNGGVETPLRRQVAQAVLATSLALLALVHLLAGRLVQRPAGPLEQRPAPPE